MFDLKLLGGATLLDSSGAVGSLSGRRHPLALLVLLAISPSRTLSRGKLVGYLWPEVREETARNRLSSCLYHLRQELGPAAVATAGADLRLDAASVACDVWQFGEALAMADPARAVEIYTGPFLDGFRLGGSPEFEHRVDRERDRLRDGYYAALEALAAAAADRGEPEAAAAWWRERAAADPYDSRVAGRLVTAVAAAGNRAGALRIAREHTQRIREELGDEPGAGFQTMVAALEPVAPIGTGRNRPGPGDATDASPANGLVRDLPITSVAVLPFKNLSGTAEAEPFSIGMHDDLLTELARVPALTVISRTSVLRYAATTESIQEIARELGVGTVIEGGVQTAAGRLRLNVQLIDARSGMHRWAERYDRELSTESLFDIQTELAIEITRALEAELAPAGVQRPASKPAADLDAYRLCVQGRVLLDQRTSHEIYRAIDYFQRAIERQPGYALAWSGLADALSLLEFYDYAPPAGAPDARDAALRGVELDPYAGQTHASLGIISSIRQSGSVALRALERAVELAPGYAEAHTWLGWLHLMRGNPGQALPSSTRSVELDPLAPASRVYLAESLLAGGDGPAALREAGRAREIRPAYGLAHYMEGLVLYHLGQAAEAAEALRRAHALVPCSGSPSHAEVHAILAVIRAQAGDQAGARELLAQIKATAHPFSAGLVHAALGDIEAAFDAFERVRRWDSFSTEHLRYFFPDVLGPLRADPRYPRILRQVDLVWNG